MTITPVVPGRAQPPEPAGDPSPVPEVPAKAMRGPCRDCGRDMITYIALRQDPGLRDRYVCFGGHGMCNSCYYVAWRRGIPTRPASEPRQSLNNCKDCDREMTTWYQRREHPDRYADHVLRGGYGMCSACYYRAQHAGTLPDPAPRRRRGTGAPPADPAEVARMRAQVGVGPGPGRHARGEVDASRTNP